MMLTLVCSFLILFGSNEITFVKNINGPTLGYSTSSGVKIIEVDGKYFKDLNKNGKLDDYEDWRLSFEERAKDLASKLSIEQIAGLMLYSSHQSVPASGGWFGGTYNGKSYQESGAEPWDLSDQQKEFLTKDHLRHVLVTSVESPEVAAKWNNNLQALVESLDFGIPVNISSDPRHGAVSDTEYNAGAGGEISMWPNSLGLAATFDPELVKRFGEIASIEYRALGIATALSPQIDLATDPRWSRVNGTFGEDPKLAADMAKAYIDGFQTSSKDKEIINGWGYESVNAMAKHWPGGGTGEGGRDAHYSYGKYAVYPGNNFDMHLIPFVEGAFNLDGGTEKTAAIMPYYTISFNQDVKYKENVGNSYSKYIINDLLRTVYQYDGVICTDWGITADQGPTVDSFQSRPWGVEHLTEAERHYKIIMAGVDQFGGNNKAEPVIEAYKLGVEEHGEEFMRARFEQSATRLLKNIFQVGLFENPYLEVEETKKIVGNPQFMTEGYEAQLKSVVMLKNKNNVLPLVEGQTVYIPKRYSPESKDWFGNVIPESYDYPISIDIAKKYFNVTDNPEMADVAICFINSPNTGVGYDANDLQSVGNGYFPISLQYGPYTAVYARETSIAGGDPLENFMNRSYKGKTVVASNIDDLFMVLDTYRAMKGKPVIVVLNMSKPTIVSEFEGYIDGLLVTFDVQSQAIFDIITGKFEPQGLLPMQMPTNMKTVELQNEDVPHDMECYVDSEGNVYDFGFGLNWSGRIIDDRVIKYVINK